MEGPEPKLSKQEWDKMESEVQSRFDARKASDLKVTKGGYLSKLFELAEGVDPFDPYGKKKTGPIKEMPKTASTEVKTLPVRRKVTPIPVPVPVPASKVQAARATLQQILPPSTAALVEPLQAKILHHGVAEMAPKSQREKCAEEGRIFVNRKTKNNPDGYCRNPPGKGKADEGDNPLLCFPRLSSWPGAGEPA